MGWKKREPELFFFFWGGGGEGMEKGRVAERTGAERVMEVRHRSWLIQFALWVLMGTCSDAETSVSRL